MSCTSRDTKLSYEDHSIGIFESLHFNLFNSYINVCSDLRRILRLNQQPLVPYLVRVWFMLSKRALSFMKTVFIWSRI